MIGRHAAAVVVAGALVLVGCGGSNDTTPEELLERRGRLDSSIEYCVRGVDVLEGFEAGRLLDDASPAVGQVLFATMIERLEALVDARPRPDGVPVGDELLAAFETIDAELATVGYDPEALPVDGSLDDEFDVIEQRSLELAEVVLFDCDIEADEGAGDPEALAEEIEDLAGE